MIEHVERKHALLAPSAAHRWMECPPSAKLCEQYEEKPSKFAQQGTDAHELCQFKVEQILGLPTEDPRSKLQYFDNDMEIYTDQYAMYVDATAMRMGATEVLVEQKVDFSEYVPDGYGHCDCLMYSDTKLKVIDFKYGNGVFVDARYNPQMMCYALGALKILGDKADSITEVSMEIFQPRMHSISYFSMQKDELLEWAENELKEKAQLAYNGEGKLNAGQHCLFCKAKKDCEEYEQYRKYL